MFWISSTDLITASLECWLERDTYLKMFISGWWIVCFAQIFWLFCCSVLEVCGCGRRWGPYPPARCRYDIWKFLLFELVDILRRSISRRQVAVGPCSSTPSVVSGRWGVLGMSKQTVPHLLPAYIYMYISLEYLYMIGISFIYIWLEYTYIYIYISSLIPICSNWNIFTLYCTGWWFGTWFLFTIGNVIIPSDLYIFQRGRLNHQPYIHGIPSSKLT